MPRIANNIIIAFVSFIFLQVGSLYADVSYTIKVKNTEFIGIMLLALSILIIIFNKL